MTQAAALHPLFPSSATLPPAAAEPIPAPSRPGRPGREAFRVCVLGSGSGGNCTVVRFTAPGSGSPGDGSPASLTPGSGTPASGSLINATHASPVPGRVTIPGGGDGTAGRATTLLIDLGFGPRTLDRRLAQVGLSLDEIDAVCLTHLDQDHFRRSWTRGLLRHRIPVHLHHWHRPDLHALPGGAELEAAGLVRLFNGEPFHPLDHAAHVTVRTARCQHDRQGTIAYRFDAPHGSLGYATDLGHVPPSVIEHLAGVDLLAIESNYDEHMTIHSSRPTFVNRRNMSDSGHLSNEQAFDAVQRIAAASPHGNPRHVVLLHRSSQCNHPTKVRRVFERSTPLARRIVLTEQRRRTRWLPVRPLRRIQRTQLPLIF